MLMIDENTLENVVSTKTKNIVRNYVRNLSVSARRPMLLEALLAVHGPALGGLERDLALLAAVRALGLVHLAWTLVDASSLTQLFHSF